MSILTGLTTKEEIAEIIFNSDNPELNDMIQKAKVNNYEVNHLIWKIMADINTHYGDELITISKTFNTRKDFLFSKIKSELAYYAKSNK